MPSMMKTAVYYALNDIRLKERPIPEIGPDDLLLNGVFTMGASATESTSIAMYLEEAAKSTHLAMLRGPVEELSPEEVERCYRWFRKNYGQSGNKTVNS